MDLTPQETPVFLSERELPSTRRLEVYLPCQQEGELRYIDVTCAIRHCGSEFLSIFVWVATFGQGAETWDATHDDDDD